MSMLKNEVMKKHYSKLHKRNDDCRARLPRRAENPQTIDSKRRVKDAAPYKICANGRTRFVFTQAQALATVVSN